MPFRDQHHQGRAAHHRAGRSGQFGAGRWQVEVLLFVGMLVIYQLSRTLVIGDATKAIHNAFNVINLEKAVGVFVEPSVQSAVVDNLHLMQALNLFYLWAHLPVTAAFFIWLYRRRQYAYRFVRNAFFLANLFALAVFVVFPVAPPRMMHDQGFVDTLSLFSGIDLHGGNLSGLFNPFAAVPSMHMGYALMVGVVAAALIKSWPLRIAVLLYPMLVLFTIVGTANHYVVDAVAGGAVMTSAFVATAVLTRRAGRPAARSAALTD